VLIRGIQMVYIASWQAFQEAAEVLYAKSPEKTRYCVKWKASEGKLVLKITDNVECIKYKTHSSIFLNRFEALNLSLMQKMANYRPPPPPEKESIPTPSPGTPVPGQKSDPNASNAGPTAAGSVASGGVKKKSKKKKK